MKNHFSQKLKALIAQFAVFLLKAGEEILVGGQAVCEGVMMRSTRSYSIAVRKWNGSIAVKKDYLIPLSDKNRIWGYPVIRGVVTLGRAFTLGIRALKFSTDQVLASLPEQNHRQVGSQHQFGAEKEMSAGRVALNILFAIFFFVLLFKLLPLLLTSRLKDHFALLENRFVFTLMDGGIRLLVFLGYIFLISKIKEIRRIFEYHGAEHKVVFTYEAGEDLLVQNARKYSTLHPRCGTSFLMVVMLTSTFIYAFIPFEDFALKLLSRVVLIPLIAGISYEIIRFAARRKNFVLSLITQPGLWLQKITTKEPSDDQLEIAIKALNEALTLENAEGQLAVI